MFSCMSAECTNIFPQQNIVNVVSWTQTLDVNQWCQQQSWRTNNTNHLCISVSMKHCAGNVRYRLQHRLLSQFMISNKHMRLYENAVLPTGRIKSRWRDVLHGVQSETLALNFSLLPLSFAWHCQEVLAPATPILCVGHVLLVFWLHTVCIAYEILFL